MNVSNTTTPHFESLFLKRNAFLSIAIGMLLIAVMAAEYSKNAFSDMGWIAFSIGLFTGLCFVFLVVAIIRIMKVIPKARSAWMYGNYHDEYFNHLNHRAYKYAFNLTASLAGASYIGSLLTILPDWYVMHVGPLVLISLFFSYGMPILIWLGGDNE